MNIVVVDDFYEKPEVVRQLALGAQYRDVTKMNYPGFQSLQSYSSNALVGKFEKVLGRKLVIDPSSLTFGRFRIMLEETGSRLKVHLDGFCDWTGVLYLNPNSDCRGGTGFYRHRRTGIDNRLSEEESRARGFANWEDLERSIIEPDTLNADAWEQTGYVAMKFNRLVLFKGNLLFHCHTESFGADLKTGRMTQNFFFKEELS